MDTHTTQPRGPVVLAEPVWHALARYTAFSSSTPAAFDAKTAHFPPAAKLDTAIIISDVLRATSTLTAVAAAGAARILVAPKPKKGTLPFTPPTTAVPWLFGGEEHGRAIPGGCIANSPIEATEALFYGANFKFVSTNGARTVKAAEDAGFSRLYLACLPNITATVDQAIADGARRVLFAGGGFYGSGVLEDTVCAGLGVKALCDRGFTDNKTLDGEARIAMSTANDYADAARLVEALQVSEVGHLLTDIGRGADIEAVVTGAGIVPIVWRRMATTVLRYTSIDGIGIFAPVDHQYSHALREAA